MKKLLLKRSFFFSFYFNVVYLRIRNGLFELFLIVKLLHYYQKQLEEAAKSVN